MRRLLSGLALALLSLSTAAVALADDERPRSTVSRPGEHPKRELILLVGGLDSSASDST